ncbi:g11387 [Coccomyxa viridis]|uniref:G11387 protein n=1 Tax=Coccomyxa viridis TaxID=1274662 RepID=A0ABP1GEU5_9CHLO
MSNSDSASIAGIRGQPAPKDWMRNVNRALSTKQGSYDIQAQSSSDGLKVTIRWHEADLRVRASLTLPVAKDENAMASMLKVVWNSLEITQDACAELTSSDAKRRQQADSCQAEFRKVVDSIQKDKQENYIKFAAVVNEKKQKLREQQEHIQRLEERIQRLEGGLDQEDGSGAASPPRDVAEQDHDSVYDAETEPSAGEDEVEAQMDLEDTYQTQRRRPAGTFGIGDTLASHDKAQCHANGKAPTTRSQAEKDALLAAVTQPMEPDEEHNKDEEMQEKHAIERSNRPKPAGACPAACRVGVPKSLAGGHSGRLDTLVGQLLSLISPDKACQRLLAERSMALDFMKWRGGTSAC